MSSKKHLNAPLIQQFTQLIATHTGLHIRPQDQHALEQKIWVRMKVLRLSLPEAYYQLLESKTSPAECEWQELAILLTTLETYFFRDQGQFSLLRNQIFPKLIEHRRQNHLITGEKTKPSLRIWSAGCSTGEEPYSIAILLKEILPDWDSWEITILGTDINQKALQKARQGIYSTWSFRLVEPEIKAQYFTPIKTEWRLQELICNQVKLHYLNLMTSRYTNNFPELGDLDLIICRNVFVYFESPAISAVLKKFYEVLRPGGYLLTGHAEIQGQNLGLFQTEVFPKSVIYQRPETVSVRASNTSTSSQIEVENNTEMPLSQNSGMKTREQQNNLLSPQLSVLNSAEGDSLQLSHTTHQKTGDSAGLFTETSTTLNIQKVNFHTLLKEAESLFQKKAYSEALKKVKQVLSSQPRHLGAYHLIAQLYANLGKYDQATHYCFEALKVDPLSNVAPYYLLAYIAEEKGDIEEAKILFKKIVYLAPTSIYAYLELAFIYEKEGNSTRAKKMQTVALEMLKNLPPNSIVAPKGELTAENLMMKVKKMLSNQP